MANKPGNPVVHTSVLPGSTAWTSPSQRIGLMRPPTCGGDIGQPLTELRATFDFDGFRPGGVLWEISDDAPYRVRGRRDANLLTDFKHGRSRIAAQHARWPPRMMSAPKAAWGGGSQATLNT